MIDPHEVTSRQRSRSNTGGDGKGDNERGRASATVSFCSGGRGSGYSGYKCQ